MKMKFELLVFDWDGTLMDSEARIVECVRAAIKDLRLPSLSNEAISDIIGLGLREAVDRLFPGADEELHQALVSRYRAHYFDELRTPSPLFQGAREVIEELLQADYLLAVATGKSRAGLNRALQETGMADLFHTTRCADETFSKPHPLMLEQITDELGVSPHAALMIGDTEYDLQMARNAGMPSLAVTYGVHATDRLLRHHPMDCVASVSAIPGWLQGQNETSTNAVV
jgi:phosphoglycolate phosphatase